MSTQPSSRQPQLARRAFLATLATLLPLVAMAAQPPAPAAPAPGAATTATAPGGPPMRPQRTAAESEKDLGLTDPANPKLPSLILISDSTVRNGHGKGDQGQWGWGKTIEDLFDPTKINVVNRAIGGLSSHSYIQQGHWDLALQIIKPGDIVLIQWGHNDGGIQLPNSKPIPDAGLPPGATPPPPPPGAMPRGPNASGSLPGIGEETYDVENPRTHVKETVHTYGWYLRKYVADVKAKGATPIICSLIPRKIWKDGKVVRQTDTYRGWAQQVAEQQHIGFVDLNEIIARRYDVMGEAAVEPMFADPHTHTSWDGAVLNAECVVSGLKALPGHPLDKYLNAKGKAIAPYKA